MNSPPNVPQTLAGVTPQDLRHCAAEAIHTPEKVQSYGALVACDATTGRIIRHSHNAAQWPLGDPARPLQGQPLRSVLALAETVWDGWVQKAQAGMPTRVGRIPSQGQEPPLEMLIHRTTSGDGTGLLILEFIPDYTPGDTQQADVEMLGRLARAIRGLTNSESIADFARDSAWALQQFLGYDRVMLYQFASDWSGVVIAEATSPGVSPQFLGHRFPASDIPQQARELYQRNLLRVIGDVQATPSPLNDLSGAAMAPLDQSHCLLRQPSSMHVTYLQNMGVRATLTISLLHQGRLWGMLACHHHAPRIPPLNHRHSTLVACELIADTLASHLDGLLRIQALEQRRVADDAIAALAPRLKASTTREQAWDLLATALCEMAGASHVFGYAQGVHMGPRILSEHALHHLKKRLASTRAGHALTTDCVQGWGWTPEDFACPENIAGLLAVSPMGDTDTFLVLLRPEWVYTVPWGGQPDRFSEITLEDGRKVLGARQSFALWLEDIKGHCLPWTESDTYVACQLATLAQNLHTRSLLRAKTDQMRVLGASLEHLQDMVLVTQAEPAPGQLFRKTTYVNAALLRHTGYAQNEVLGQSPSMFQGPGTNPAQMADIARGLKQWQPIHETLLNYKKSGEPYWVDLRIIPVANASGRFTHWISVQRDVTETMRLQQQLATEKDRLQSVIVAIGAGTWTQDLISGFRTLDEEASGLLGYAAAELGNLTEQSASGLVHPEDLALLQQSKDACLSGAKEFHDVTVRIRHRSRRWIWIHVRGRVVRRDKQGRPTLLMGTFTDASERVAMRHALARQNQFLVDLTSQLPGVVFQFHRSPDGTYALPFASSNAGPLFGVSAAAMMDNVSALFERLEPADLPGVLASIEASAQSLAVWRQRIRIRPLHPQNPAQIAEGYAVPTAQADGSVVWHGFVTDATQQAQVEHALEHTRLQLQATVGALPDPLIELDAHLQIVAARAPSGLILGVESGSLPGLPVAALLTEPAYSIFQEALRQTHIHGHIQNMEFPLAIGGALRHFEFSMAEKAASGIQAHSGYVMTIRDITGRREAEETIEQLAFHDPLTGLLNRRALLERLQQLQTEAMRGGKAFAVLFIDLDHFKDLNDTVGHQVGDELLREVARRLREHTSYGATLVRLGADEFVVVVGDLATGEQAAVDVGTLAETIREALSHRFETGGKAYTLTCSIGITVADSSVYDPTELLNRAELARYQAKSDGRNLCRFFDAATQSTILRRHALQQELRQAIERDELRLHYQPIVDTHRTIRGYEALVRWQHPLRGMIAPGDFIPLAEQSDLILAIGRWVLHTACVQLRHWQGQAATHHYFIAVNVSARQLEQPDFVSTVQHLLQQTGADPTRLKIEVTESHLHSNIQSTAHKMQALTDHGVQFALDDFGTGYSSLSYLKQLPLHQLKIDRSFVSDLLHDPDDAAIAQMIVQLAATLNLTVVAEGVENEAQMQFLIALGCQYFQGYLIGKPAQLPPVQ